MKVFATIQLIVTLLTTATAQENVRGARQLTNGAKITTMNPIMLSPGNEVSPFIGVPGASGIAIVKLDYNPSRTSSKWKACIKTTILGFFPGLLHIHTGKIAENGGVVVDFSPMLKQNSAFDGCTSITQATYNDIRLHPVRKHRAASMMFSPNCVHNSDCF